MQKEVEMINGIGPTGSNRVDMVRTDTPRSTAASVAAPASKNAQAADVAANPVDSLVSQGAPIDMDKVARIKAAIAEGRYPVNPQLIAQKMIELDLPAKG
jgi:negative regulator of flagellin synthesis FlgM